MSKDGRFLYPTDAESRKFYLNLHSSSLIIHRIVAKKFEIRNSTAEFLTFIAEGQENGIQVLYKGETIWATQKAMAELFGVDRTVITKHLKNIFDSSELQQDSVCAKFAHTAEDGKTYNTTFYNLDAIISVGYRVNSVRATQFRQWCTFVLRQFAIRGYIIDKKRMRTSDPCFSCFVPFKGGQWLPLNVLFCKNSNKNRQKHLGKQKYRPQRYAALQEIPNGVFRQMMNLPESFPIKSKIFQGKCARFSGKNQNVIGNGESPIRMRRKTAPKVFEKPSNVLHETMEGFAKCSMSFHAIVAELF